MSSAASSIPSIRITPAPPQKIYPEPYSPVPPAKLDVDEDGYRSKWLSPPPSAQVSRSLAHPSPLRPDGSTAHKGLSQDQFSSLLKVSRDQRAKVEMQGMFDLRKEVVLKNQRLKQLERRSRFLSKIKDPSFTPTAFDPEISPELPMTGPRSVSLHGFATFDDAAEKKEKPQDTVVSSLSISPARNQQVQRDLRKGLPIAEHPLASPKSPRAAPKRSPCFSPSLDEIAARLKPMQVSLKRSCSPSRLPNFLMGLSLSPGSRGGQMKHVAAHRPDPFSFKLGSRRLVLPRPVDVAAC